MKILLPSVYFGNITYYALLKNHEAITEVYEHFVKQTYRNRCTVYGANGKLDLVVPVEKSKSSARKIMKDVCISYNEPWQKTHWRSLESAYRTSPYFEYYENEFQPLYQKKIRFLVDWNEMLQDTIIDLLKLEIKPKKTEKYEEDYPGITDFRNAFDPNKKQAEFPENHSKEYIQVFGNKYGFIENLSIADLLFNAGPEAIEYL